MSKASIDDIRLSAGGICKMDIRRLDAIERIVCDDYASGSISREDWLLKLRKHSKVYESGPTPSDKSSEYCYEGSSVLKNKLKITDKGRLYAVENAVATFRIEEILAQNCIRINQFGINTLSRLHQFIFGDIYSFAGQFRTEDIARDGKKFCPKETIKMELPRIAMYIVRGGNFALDDLGHFVQHISSTHSVLNSIHPFRDGNGRTIRLFLTMLARNAGYELEYSLYDKQKQIEADREAMNGNPNFLVAMYSQITVPFDGSYEIQFTDEGEILPPLSKVIHPVSAHVE
ncbi:MAG: Fic family protein [Sphaerochaetaceae bacterium]|nr:Fic family protein [Sphaerochaetaceae bacterium]MDD4006995.1 Fic family protein [Sphaerochaetaceae bacterium]